MIISTLSSLKRQYEIRFNCVFFYFGKYISNHFFCLLTVLGC